MVCPRLSEVKNNCSSYIFDGLNASINCLLKHQAATLGYSSLLIVALKDPRTWLKHVHMTNDSGVKPLSQAVLTSKKNAPQLPLDELEPLSFSQRRRKRRNLGCLWNPSRSGASAEEL